MNLEQQKNIIKNSLKDHLEKHLPPYTQNDIYRYILFPTGKLFRSLVAHAVFKDITQQHKLYSCSEYKQNHENLNLICSSLEIHHAYTLVHDDLPCLDDDDFRRNRPSAHKAFSEGSAVIAADALHALSYKLLLNINYKNNSTRFIELLKLFSHCTGMKNLIGGQFFEVTQSQVSPFSVDEILFIHKLKTARLIQYAHLAPLYLIHEREFSSQEFNKKFRLLFKLGFHMGIAFQILDDYKDSLETQNLQYEEKVNIFLLEPEKALNHLNNHFESTIEILNKARFNNTDSVFKRFLHDSLSKRNLPDVFPQSLLKYSNSK